MRAQPRLPLSRSPFVPELDAPWAARGERITIEVLANLATEAFGGHHSVITAKNYECLQRRGRRVRDLLRLIYRSQCRRQPFTDGTCARTGP